MKLLLQPDAGFENQYAIKVNYSTVKLFVISPGHLNNCFCVRYNDDSEAANPLSERSGFIDEQL